MTDNNMNIVAEAALNQIYVLGATIKFIFDALLPIEFLLSQMPDDGMLNSTKQDGIDLLNKHMETYENTYRMLHQTDMIELIDDENKQILLTLNEHMLNMNQTLLKKYSKQQMAEVIPINQKVH